MANLDKSCFVSCEVRDFQNVDVEVLFFWEVTL